MATLKSIKNNYDLLTKAERFGLYQKASLRKDESELAAIYNATPKKTYEVIDFYFLCEEIFRLDAINLLQRLGHSNMYDWFMNFAATREDDEKKSEYFCDAASLSAYLYVIETDAWKIVCDNLGFEVDWFRKLSGEFSFAVQMMTHKDEIMRQFAFDEDEAEKFIKKSAKRLKINQNFEIKTLGEQIKFYRDFIEEL